MQPGGQFLGLETLGLGLGLEFLGLETNLSVHINNTPHARQLFVGLESGVVEEFTLARDYNRLDSSRVYHAHDKVA